MSRYWFWGYNETESTPNASENSTSNNYNTPANNSITTMTTATNNINDTQSSSSAIDIDSNNIPSNSPITIDKTNASTNTSPTSIDTYSVTSETLSTTSTLLEDDSPTSSAIPIPKRSSNNRRTYDDQKSKSSSSFRSWWSSSASRSSPIPSNLPEKKGLQEIKENVKLTNPSDRLLNMSSRNHIHSLHSSSTNPTTAVDMTTVKAEMIERRVRKSGSPSSLSNLLEPNNGKRKRRTESHPAIPIEFTGENMVRQTSTQSAPDISSDSKRDHVLIKEETRLSTSNASTSSRSSWWRLVGVTSKDDSSKEPSVVEINNSVHIDNNNNNTTESIQKDNRNSMAEEPEKTLPATVSSNESANTQHAVSEENAVKTESANGHSVTKKRSGEVKRWSLFGTWSASTPDLTEQMTEEHLSRSFTEPTFAENLSSQTSSTSSSSKQKDPAQSSSSTTNSNSTTQPQMTEIGREQKSPQRSTPYTKHALNPVVQTLPQTRSSWLHFFSSDVAKSAVKIDNGSDRKLIQSSEMIEKKEQSIASPARIDQQSSTPKIITKETEERKSLDSSTTVQPPSPKAKPLNKVLPSFDELPQFNSHRRPDSFVQQTLHAINTYLFPPDKQPSGKLPRWLDEITRSSLDVKKIAVIGVHGWFPETKFVRTVIGEPTGTSPKFCDMMQKAVVNYLAQHNTYLPENAITLIPLEGEGKIDARVDILYTNFLRNKVWQEALRAADVVFVTTHSQGTPVSTMLLSRLISTKHVQPKRQRIGMLAMAGVSHGPFPSLKNNLLVKYEADAARELFEFMNSDSTVVKKYRAALKIVINAGVKMVYVASMDDQVVPLYSAVFTGINHPSVLRAIYIDGPIYQADDFLMNLIVFAIRLRNHGISDHGLLVPLSEVVAGSFYCEGHSTLYEDLNVYNLCVRYLFETSTSSPSKLKLQQFHAHHRINPHSLPWAMRGILEDKSILSSDTLSREIERLRKQYEDWEPTSKPMKDVKFRLEPFVDTFFSKSKL